MTVYSGLRWVDALREGIRSVAREELPQPELPGESGSVRVDLRHHGVDRLSSPRACDSADVASARIGKNEQEAEEGDRCGLSIWHHNVKEGNFLVKKAKDVLILLGVGATILLSVAVSAATGAFTDAALEAVGQRSGPVATTLTRLVGVALGLLTSTGLFLFLRLPKVQSPVRRVIRGALLAAVLFEVLKRLGAFYGSFAVVVGLLVWINIVSRMLLLCAAWTVTAPYDSDIEPSGTANAAAARRAGIPAEFADEDPDDAPALQEDGAPSRLAAAVQGRVPPQDVPEGRRAAVVGDRGAAPRPTLQEGAASPAATATLVRPDDRAQGRAEAMVRSAAQFTAGALGMATVAVGLHVGRTVRDVLRR